MAELGIPKFIEPFRLCDKGYRLNGAVSFSRLPRLMALLFDSEKEGRLNVELDFRIDEQGARIVLGRMNTSLDLTCQRCLKKLEKVVESEFTFAFIKSDTDSDLLIESLPNDYEVISAERREVNILQAIEDEILLSLPMYAYHEDEACNDSLTKIRELSTALETQKPFAVLGELLKK